MDLEISNFGTILGLSITILLILRSVSPAYAMMLGALIRGLVGGLSLMGAVQVMV